MHSALTPSTGAASSPTSVSVNFARFYVPCSAHAALIGKGGSVLKKIEATHNVRIRIPKLEEHSDLVTVQSLSLHLSSEPIQAVVQEFTAILGYPPSAHPLVTVEFDIAPRSYGAVIGPQGSILHALQSKTHTSITVPKKDNPGPESHVTATGTKDAVLHLQKELEQILGSVPRIIGGPISDEEKKAVRKKLDLSGHISEALFFPEAPDSNVTLFRMLDYIRSAAMTLDIAVYNMTDDRIARVVEDAHIDGVAVRIISHVTTLSDPGSDVHSLADIGVKVKIDVSPQLMHHKFAVIDKKVLINGSFNWTRSAAEGNAENVIITNETGLVKAFADHFEAMWSNSHKLKVLEPHSTVLPAAADAGRN